MTNKKEDYIPSDNIITEIASHLDGMGDETRLKILFALSAKERGVLELAELLGMTMPAISHHLRILKTKSLVKRRKEGINVFYRLIDNCIIDVLRTAKNHIENSHSSE